MATRNVGCPQRLTRLPARLRNLRLPGWRGPGRVFPQWVHTQRSGQNRSDPATQSYRDFAGRSQPVARQPATGAGL